MRTISATDAKQQFSQVLADAANEPVVIRKHDRDVAVVLSMRAWRRLTRLNILEFQVFCDRVAADASARGLDDAGLAALLRDDE